MKILVTSDTFLPLLGGGEIHVFEMCHRLVRHGHEVTLVTNQDGKGKKDDEFAFRVVRVVWKRKSLPKLFKILWQESKRVDIIHAHYSYRLTAMATLVGRLRNKPSVSILHGLGTLDEPGAQFPYKQIHAIYRFLALNLATRIISTSEDIAVVARRYLLNPKKISIIFNGLDTTKFYPSTSVPKSLEEKYKNKKVILTVRRLVPKNGIHFLVEAMPDIIKLVPNVMYIMIGTGRMEDHIKGRIRALGVEKYIDVIGQQDNTLIPGFLARADVVVFPSTAESTSIACAEAMSMGKIVVASRVGGLVELLGTESERGILVKLVDWQGSNYDAPISLAKGRYEALARAICEALLGDQSKRKEKAIQFAKTELDWEVVVEKTLKVFKELI